jgi:hypothetical protein
MDWNMVGAIGEILGACGVIATLIYLSVQIRQNTRQMRGEAVTALAQITDRLTSELRDDPELLSIVLVAARNWSDPSLTPQDLGRVHLFNLQEFQRLQTEWQLMREGLIDANAYAVEEAYTLRRLMEPGVQTWWNEHRYFLSDEFVDRMNTQLKAAPPEPASAASEISFYDGIVAARTNRPSDN